MTAEKQRVVGGRRGDSKKGAGGARNSNVELLWVGGGIRGLP